MEPSDEIMKRQWAALECFLDGMIVITAALIVAALVGDRLGDTPGWLAGAGVLLLGRFLMGAFDKNCGFPQGTR